MKPLFKRASTGLAVLLLGLAGCMSGASQAEEYVEGKDYDVINPPLPTQVEEGRIEVASLFWYGCPHCFTLEPTLHKYLENKPENVDFIRVPATFSPLWKMHARLYYVGQALDPDGTKDVHNKIFTAMHKQGRRINSEEAAMRYLKSLGLAQDDIDSAYQHMGLVAQVNLADEITRKSKTDSVPAVIINGKYITSPSKLGSYEKLIKVINFLTEKESK